MTKNQLIALKTGDKIVNVHTNEEDSFVSFSHTPLTSPTDLIGIYKFEKTGNWQEEDLIKHWRVA